MDEWGRVILGILGIVFVALGIYVAWKRPPRLVEDRYWLLPPTHHSECVRRNDKGSCTSSREWTTMDPHYYAVSRDGATCEVASFTYFGMERGRLLKCWQLFGWAGGASDRQLAATMPRESGGVGW